MIQKVHRVVRVSTRSFTVSAAVAGGITGRSIDRDVDALVDKQGQVAAIKRLRSPARCRFITRNRSARSQTMPVFNEERDATSSHSAAGAGGSDRSRESAATERQHTCKSPELKLPIHAHARPQSGCASSNVREVGFVTMSIACQKKQMSDCCCCLKRKGCV